jgi:hypothetical protein
MNGTRLTVWNIHEHSWDIESIINQRTGQRILLPRIDLTQSDSTFFFLFTRCKFPIKIAFSMVNNKVQVQTLDKLGLYLLQPVFSYIIVNFILSCPELDLLKN